MSSDRSVPVRVKPCIAGIKPGPRHTFGKVAMGKLSTKFMLWLSPAQKAAFEAAAKARGLKLAAYIRMAAIQIMTAEERRELERKEREDE